MVYFRLYQLFTLFIAKTTFLHLFLLYLGRFPLYSKFFQQLLNTIILSLLSFSLPFFFHSAYNYFHQTPIDPIYMTGPFQFISFDALGHILSFIHFDISTQIIIFHFCLALLNTGSYSFLIFLGTSEITFYTSIVLVFLHCFLSLCSCNTCNTCIS